MKSIDERLLQINRRTFLSRTGVGLGATALASLMGTSGSSASARAGDISSTGALGIVQPRHFAPKAKRVIYLYMAGGPSHLETWDYKPKLQQMHGKPFPESITRGQPIAQLQGAALNCFGPQHKFRYWGQSRQHFSELFPHIGTVADDITIVRSMVTEAINHDPAHTFMNTGTQISGRPAMGAWALYGLGSECDNLPGFVVLNSLGKFGQAQPIAARMWHSGFLPSKYQGVQFHSKGDAVLYVSSPPGVNRERQADVVQTVEQLNRLEDNVVHDSEIATRIAQYEMAFRMQLSVPQLTDISDEPQSVLDMYGTKGADGSFGGNCLLARRLAERGVRFIQLYHRDWDHHGNLKGHIAGTAAEVDQGFAALIKDLKQRGMLEDTLVIWGGEFGRTPMAQGSGRDHHMKGFSIWMAGAGIKRGFSLGSTDDFGYNSVEDVVHVHDLHATMLQLLGIDHKRLVYRFQGRDFRLTDVGGKTVEKLLA